MRTALRRARRLGAFLLITLAAGWVVLRRRSPVRWIEPAPGSPASVPAGVPAAAPAAEIGAPGEVPADVLATDAGLTELPDGESGPAPSGTVVVDEVLVGELLAEVPADRDVDEAAFEQALVDATPAPTDAPADALSGDAPAVAGDEELVDTDPLAAPDPLTPSEPAETVRDADAEGAVAEVVAAEPVETVVADEPDVAGPADDELTAPELTAPELTAPELTAPELGNDEPTMTIARDTIAAENEETGTRIPMPTFSEAPTMEIPAVTDDLRAVRGIGPSMERMLHGLGIISFRQLAMLDGVGLERVRAELSDFRTRIEREDWVGQARDLHKEKYGRDPS